jgi:NAD(P)H-hydrate epimerase
VQDLVKKWQGPLVVDADGLNALAEKGLPRFVRDRIPPVLTPHPGEMARLTGHPISELTSDPIEAAREFTIRHRVVLLLKGAPSVIADSEGHVLVNPTGNPGLATGGSGDVLSGIIGALLARGVDPFHAAASASFLFGLAADRLAERVGERSVVPSRVAAELPTAWTAIEGCINGG